MLGAWKDDGLTVFNGGCDKQVKIWDPGIKIVFRQHLEDKVVSEEDMCLSRFRIVYKWLEENVVAQLLTDEEIIESVIGINKDDIDEEDDESSTMEPPSRNEAIKAAITLNNFLLSYEKTTPEVLTMLRKIRDEIQGEIDFNKKQKTIESFFKKPS
ncbi:hypothetical protein Tco_0826237 [Tanacetum coccineum]